MKYYNESWINKEVEFWSSASFFEGCTYLYM